MTTPRPTALDSLDATAQALRVLTRVLDRQRAVEREIQARYRDVDEAAELIYGEAVNRAASDAR